MKKVIMIKEGCDDLEVNDHYDAVDIMRSFGWRLHDESDGSELDLSANLTNDSNVEPEPEPEPEPEAKPKRRRRTRKTQ